MQLVKLLCRIQRYKRKQNRITTDKISLLTETIMIVEMMVREMTVEMTETIIEVITEIEIIMAITEMPV